jgi:hypothetical protein
MLIYIWVKSPPRKKECNLNIKILFIGLERFIVRANLRILTNSLPKLKVEDLVAISTKTAVEIAAKNPEIKFVLFLGYLMDGASVSEAFKQNVRLAQQLKKILPTAVMIASTSDSETDNELVAKGLCKFKIDPGESFIRRLSKELHEATAK